MITQEQISSVLDSQKQSFDQKETGQIRESLDLIPAVDNFATIITGLRRCGKSTLLLQYQNQQQQNTLFFNLEDIRLAGFEVSDFSRLLNEIVRRNAKILFFDEIQLVKGWEIFVHQLLRDGYQVFITGSNASLLSRELGTHLTGRHLDMELFPFSYREFTTFKKLGYNAESLIEYLKTGGIPEYVKSGVGTLMNRLLDDILVRDIAIRHSVRDVESLQRLAVYLISNIGNPISANKLAGIFGIRSSATLLEFFSYFTDACLMDFVPQFSYSLKAQARNPKKVYVMDLGFYTETSTTFTDNTGHRLENLVYLHLRRHYKELFYFRQKGECDFIAFNRGKAEQVLQVCQHVDDTNLDREYNGLLEAMKEFKTNEGVIVTLDQKDRFEKDGVTVRLVPAYEYLPEPILH